MRPEFNSRRLFGITRSKGKMYEFGLPEDSHIAIPEGSDPTQLLLLTVGTLGDAAVGLLENSRMDEESNDLHFASSYFDALLESRLAPSLTTEVRLLASASYYLSGRPGSSYVIASVLEEVEDNPLSNSIRYLLRSKWEVDFEHRDGVYSELVNSMTAQLRLHFTRGSDPNLIQETSIQLRELAYKIGSARELLLVDLLCAIAERKIYSSSWINLPKFSDVEAAEWEGAIGRERFPKELWPAQLELGVSGFYSGSSGVVQMPTSAGKTRSIEIILRSAILSGRASFAIVVAPYRALSHEISYSLTRAFEEDEIRVNELSDSFQLDYLDEFFPITGATHVDMPQVVVLTPEKLLYILRQHPNVTDNLGLIIYDEGHQFDSGHRGVTYELLLTEIKKLLPTNAQTVLVSAVIQNAESIAQWLIDENAKVVSGKDLLPTSRSIAFASWLEKMGQVHFYEDDIGETPDYFVPRVIQQHNLELLGRERRPRFFPEGGDVKDIALYTGLILSPKGAVAVFCGKKSTANSIISRVVEIYERGLDVLAPSQLSDENETRKLRNLYSLHFGEFSKNTKAASHGVYAHHGTTHQGIRLSLEYAMQQGMIKFIACTSTLAQGVNLPIRYLILSGVQQGAEKIRTRDFHNLIGRAGRSGMHTEGLVIFADPKIFDGRRNPSTNWRFQSAKDLLDPAQTEPTTSSLLNIFRPFIDNRRNAVAIDHGVICRLLLSDTDVEAEWVDEFLHSNAQYSFEKRAILKELDYRRSLIEGLENYLMANRGDTPYEEYMHELEQLVSETLAYFQADDDQKIALQGLFVAIAELIENQSPDTQKQAVFAKTLLRIDFAIAIENWVNENSDQLRAIETSEEFLEATWDILMTVLGDNFLNAIRPDGLLLNIARLWIEGVSFNRIFEYVEENEGQKPWGDGYRALVENDVISYCENTLGFRFPLGVAAITQFLYGDDVLVDESAENLLNFHKQFKYGMPDELSVSCYEYGIADRMIAQGCAETARQNGFQGTYFRAAKDQYFKEILNYLIDLPSYYTVVYENT